MQVFVELPRATSKVTTDRILLATLKERIALLVLTQEKCNRRLSLLGISSGATPCSLGSWFRLKGMDVLGGPVFRALEHAP